MPVLIAVALALLAAPVFAQVYTNLDPATGRRHPATIVVVTRDQPGRAPQLTPALLAGQWVASPPMGTGPIVTVSPYDPEWPPRVRVPERLYDAGPFFVNGLAVTRPPYLAPLGWTSVTIGDYPRAESPRSGRDGAPDEGPRLNTGPKSRRGR